MKAGAVRTRFALRRRRFLEFTLVIPAMLMGTAIAAAGPAPDAASANERLLAARREIEAALICQCGCTMVVNVCDCGTAEQMRADIMDKLRGGMSKDAILASYVQQYGKEVLAAPPKKGFDLAAWVTPFAAIAAGSGLLYLLLRRWVLRRTGEQPPRSGDEIELSPAERVKYEARLEEELKKYY